MAAATKPLALTGGAFVFGTAAVRIPGGNGLSDLGIVVGDGGGALASGLLDSGVMLPEGADRSGFADGEWEASLGMPVKLKSRPETGRSATVVESVGRLEVGDAGTTGGRETGFDVASAMPVDAGDVMAGLLIPGVAAGPEGLTAPFALLADGLGVTVGRLAFVVGGLG